jgi:hypothetical protein
MAGAHSFYRGAPPAHYHPETVEALASLKERINADLAREVWEAAALNRDVLCREYLLDEREAPAAIAERRPDFAVLCDPSDDALVDEILAALEERAPHAATRVVVIAPAAGSHILIAVNALDPAEDVLVAQITGHLTD